MLRSFILSCSVLLLASVGYAQDRSHAKTHREAVDKGISYLLKSQAPDGSWSNRTGTGVTSICTMALLRNGRSPQDPAVQKALKYLEANARPDGGIYVEGSRIKNYETCLALMCLQEANQDPQYGKLVKNAERFIRGLQIDSEDGKDKSDFSYGGVGYGGEGRPDLSNTAYLVEALIAAGNGADDPAVQKALIFVSRCQNLESEHNTSAVAAKINDGGFYYSVAGEGENPKKSAEGALRSYGSMTYAGLKSMIYAGLKPDDPRVKAATAWLRKNYDVSRNPGLSDAGLYYYYQLMTKTLAVLGKDQFEDSQGVKHDWRKEVTEELARRQNSDGSWVNKNNRWLESDANLVTGYVLLSLSHCK